LTFKLAHADESRLLPLVNVLEAIGDLPRLEMGKGSEIVGYTSEPHSDYARLMRNPEGVTSNHFAAKLSKQNTERMKYVKPGGSWRDIPHPFQVDVERRAGMSRENERHAAD
jgi:DNA (cytosine-5)-methyltransferase 1